jgi:TolB protein
MTACADRPASRRALMAALLSCAVSTPAFGAPAVAVAAPADSFNGRIAFSSVRTDPQAREFDIFSVNPDGSDVRRLTTNPETDRQPDWSPGGTNIAYSIDKPDSAVNFEVARMTAAGTGHVRLTVTPDGQASTQPSWLPDGRGILFRRSGPGRASTIWQMGGFGERPALRFSPPHPPLYPSFAPDRRRVAYAGILSPDDTDRAIFTLNAGGGGLTTLYDVPGAYDSAPAWSPDGTQIAFESDADVAGANPERDMEIWVMQADGSKPTQLTGNTAHDEGPAWSPDGRLLAYTSGPDEKHGDIHVMPVGGGDTRRLTSYENADESPDWQAIRAPRSDARCGGLGRPGRGVSDVRRGGRGLTCAAARTLVRRWLATARPRRVSGYAVKVTDFGGLRRVVLRRSDGGRPRLVAFLHQPGAPR